MGQVNLKDSVVVGKWKEGDEVCLRCGASRTALKEMIKGGGKENLIVVNHILENCPSCAVAFKLSKKE